MANDPVRFLRLKELAGVELYQTTGASRFVPRHVHYVYSLSVADAGLRYHETRHEKHCVTPGSIVVVNVDEVHSGSAPVGSRYSSRAIRLDPCLLDTLFLQISGRRHDALRRTPPVINDPYLSWQISNLHTVLSGAALKLEKECLLLDALACLYERHAEISLSPALGNESIPVARVCEYLHDCYHENVSLHQLSEIAGLSAFHLSRVFTRHTGVSPHAYQSQIRLKKATDLLASGKPIAAVAYETGFCDQSHFQRVFKKKFGITPGQYEC